MSKPNFMVGTISYLPDDLPKLTQRMSHHANQLRWLESLSIDFEYLRIQSAWGHIARQNPDLDTTLRSHAIDVPAQYPGANRNELLRCFYHSNYDWLVCLDDDHRLYDRYNYREFFLDLNTSKLRSLAQRGFLITCLPASMMPYKKDNYEWQYHETHWYLHRESISGYLQICFIPNLVKFGYEPLWFNDTSPCKLNDPPEDIQFQIDWLIHKHRFVCNKNLILNEIGQSAGQDSCLYENELIRRQCVNSHKAWVARYLREKLPKTPACWTLAGLNKKFNPHFNELVPRSSRYVFSGIDLPRTTDK